MISRVEGQTTSAASAVKHVLGNRAIRRIQLAWTLGTAADWAFLVVLLVVAYDEGGTLAVGILGAVRVLPAIVVAPFATAVVERFRGDRALTAVNAIRGAGALATAAALGLGAPIELVYLLAAVVAGAGSLVRPIQLAVLPALARAPSELVAANVASSVGEGVGTFLGPLLAGSLVAWTGSMSSSVLIAVVFAAAAAAATGVRFEREEDARGGIAAGGGRVRLREAPAVLRRNPHATVVMVDFVAQVFVRGLLITLIVVTSIELLGTGAGGVGLLNAAIGLGGLVGAIGALRLAGGLRLTTVFALALVGWGLPLVLIGAWPVVALGVAALFVTGISNAVLDVAGFTLIQRGVRNEDRVTMFGVMEGLFGVAMFAGSLLAPLLVALFGPEGALVAAGTVLPVMAALTWRRISRGATRSTSRDEHIALLRRNPLFAPLPLTALDLLAESMARVEFRPDEILMRKGEPGDRYLLIASGEVEARDGERVLGTADAGDGVGEIALLRRIPRTATVIALTHVSAYEIGPGEFLAALSGPTAGGAAESLIETRLRGT
ncbi:MAG TPA: MFS transporter [Gaiellaceae bacterium]|nr:MFS transporter [Gaiellaceae bacterium]